MKTVSAAAAAAAAAVDVWRIDDITIQRRRKIYKMTSGGDGGDNGTRLENRVLIPAARRCPSDDAIDFGQNCVAVYVVYTHALMPRRICLAVHVGHVRRLKRDVESFH